MRQHSKRFAALLIGAIASMSLYAPTAASAAACSTSGNQTPSCAITVSVTVPTNLSLTFSTINSAFGSVVDGTSVNRDNAIVGNVTSNNLVTPATLTVTCTTAENFANAASVFLFKSDGNALTQGNNLSAGNCGPPLSARDTDGVGTLAFSDGLAVSIAANQSPGNYSAVLTYSVS